MKCLKCDLRCSWVISHRPRRFLDNVSWAGYTNINSLIDRTYGCSLNAFNLRLSWPFTMKMSLCECHRSSLIIIKHWFTKVMAQCCKATSHRANINPVLCLHIGSLWVCEWVCEWLVVLNCFYQYKGNFKSLVSDSSTPIAYALEILQYCTKPLIFSLDQYWWY